MQPLSYRQSAVAIELNSSKAIAGKELSLSSWCIASLYHVYHFSTVVDFSSKNYSGSTGHRNSWYRGEGIDATSTAMAAPLFLHRFFILLSKIVGRVATDNVLGYCGFLLAVRRVRNDYSPF